MPSQSTQSSDSPTPSYELDGDSTIRRLKGIVRGEKVVNRINLGRPFRLNTKPLSWPEKLSGEQESPGQADGVNWRELAFSAVAWTAIGGVIVALGYFCFRLVAFVLAN